MEQGTRILELLRSLPQPGEILLDSVGEGITGLSLRPKSIPEDLKKVRYVDLQLMKKGEPFGSGESITLMIRTGAWQQWINGRADFVIRAGDVGKGLEVIEERRNNFNRNLLHDFLNQFSLVVKINERCREGITHKDNYPHYFWDKSVAVDGCSYCSNMLSVETKISGLEAYPVIEIGRVIYFFKYWQLLPDEKKLSMKAVLKWHKALISLHHLIGRDEIDIPINFEELEKNCRDEISAASMS